MMNKRRSCFSKRFLTLIMIIVITTSATLPVYGATAHNYYKGVPAQGAAMADNVAKSIAIAIMSNPAYVTDLQKVQAAATIIIFGCGYHLGTCLL